MTLHLRKLNCDGVHCTCPVCKKAITLPKPGRASHLCRGRGLGDMVADGLAAVGVTKERVQRVASAVGIADCGCAQRQAALNRVGEAIGLPPGQTPPAS